MIVFLLVLVVAAIAAYAFWDHDLFHRRGVPEHLPAQATNMAAEQGWTPAERLQTKYYIENDSPHGTFRSQAIALGHPVDSRGRPIANKMIRSRGDTPVGVLTGAPGSGKTTCIGVPAAVMWGRDEQGYVPLGGGSPLLLVAPKSELIELSLLSRLAQGEVAVWAVDGGRYLPDVLLPYKRLWTPLVECERWVDALVVNRAMTEGIKNRDEFWAAAGGYVLAAAMWAVKHRRKSGSLIDVWQALTGANGKLGDVTAIESLYFELGEHLDPKPVADPVEWQRLQDDAEDAMLARLALEPLVVSEAPQTNSGIITTGLMALGAALLPGVGSIAYDSPEVINLEALLIDSAGTVAVVGSTLHMHAVRPLMTAFLTAVRLHTEARAFRNGGRLRRQLLVLIDELPVVVSSGEMYAEWLATSRSQGVQHMYITQSVAALDGSWGGKDWRTHCVNSTVDRLWLSMSADVESLELAVKLGGDHLVTTQSSSTPDRDTKSKGEGGTTTTPAVTTTTKTESYRDLVPLGRVAALAKGEAILYSEADRAQVVLAPYFHDPLLMSLVRTGLPLLPDGSAPEPPPPPPVGVSSDRVDVPTPDVVPDPVPRTVPDPAPSVEPTTTFDDYSSDDAPDSDDASSFDDFGDLPDGPEPDAEPEPDGGSEPAHPSRGVAWDALGASVMSPPAPQRSAGRSLRDAVEQAKRAKPADVETV